MRKLGITLIVSTLLAGCGGLALERQSRQAAVDAAAETDSNLRANAVDGPVLSEGDPYRIRRLDRIYVSTDSKPVVDPLPAVFSQKRIGVHLVDPVFLDDLALIITKLSGIPVSLGPELLSGVTKDKADIDNAEDEVAELGSETGYQNRLRVHFKDGTLEGLLNYVATALGISWKYEDSRIHFYRFITRSFVIASQQGTHTGRATITNQATGSGSSDAATASVSGSDLSTTISVDTNVWADVRSTVPTLLSEGGKYFVSESSGTVTVHDTELNLSAVEDYVNGLNDILSRQVQFHVRVLSVKQSANNQLGINWAAVWQKADRSVSFNTDRGTVTGLNSFTASLLASSQNAFAGTQAFIDALSSEGDISEVSNPQLITLNNQPTHLIIGNKQRFISSTESSINAGVNAIQSVTASTEDLITGFSLLLQPTILNNADLQVQIALDRSTLVSLNSITLGPAANQNTIQVPNVDISNSIQRVRLKSGQTIILTGFEQVTNTNNRQGVSDPDAWWLGGRKQSQTARTSIVVLLTPVIL